MFVFYRIKNLFYRLLFRLAVGPFFGNFGRRAVILRPRGIEGIRRINIGEDVYVADGGLLAAVPLTGCEHCELTIGEGCKIGSNNHIYATHSIIFESEVLTAGGVYISDNVHGYEDPAVAILKQPVQQLAKVRIGRGAWLGQNVCVIGASIGRGSVIGSNSVVLQDIPDYCVAVGAPARIVRRLDPVSGAWTRVAASSAP
jgi:acetyltransferase-like isoleucine patch superfamily enzyme